MNVLTSHGLAAGRRQLRTETGLGMGNFLWKTLTAHPGDSRPLICARPFETAWGERCHNPTLHDWARLADEYARRYAGVGVWRQDPVGVYGDHGAKYLLHFLALTRLGAIPVFVNEGMAPEAAARHMRRVGVVGVFTDEPRRAALRAAAAADLGFAVVEADFRAVTATAFAPHVHHEQDPVLITHSSGTTGIPKAVLLQHGGFFYPIARTLEGLRDPATQRAVCALPPSHNSAISAAAIAMVNNEDLILMSDLGGRPLLEAIETYRPTAVVAFPQTYVDLLASDPESRDLGSVAMWINLGDSAHEKHIRWLMRFGNHRRGGSWFGGSQFVDGLGSSEMGSMLFSIVHSPVSECLGRCVGPPRPWVEAEILDGEGTKMKDGQPGLLAVRSPSISSGYWNDSNLTYKSRLGGYFLTGDLAYRDELGRFHHLDRTTDTVAAEGGPVYTLVYEEAIMNAVDDVLDCSVIALESRPREAYLVCFAILRKGRRREARALQDEIDVVLAARSLQPLDELRVIDGGGIAVGVTGKVLKAQLRQSLRRELERRWSASASAAGAGPRERVR